MSYTGGNTSAGRPFGTPTSESTNEFTLLNDSIDDDRPYKVVVLGAGLSGILAGIRFRQRMKNIELIIYEKNSGVGGTWYSNKYPGIACDVPAHCYQFTFEEKSDWSAFYSPGPEIREDTERIVRKYQLMPYIKLNHELKHARHKPLLAEYRWDWPDIEGLKGFKGELIHTADWKTDESGWWQSSIANWKDKVVGVIGAGSTTTQVVPTLQPHVKHLYNYVRGKTWLSPPFMVDKISELLNNDPDKGNYTFSETDKEKLKDPYFFKRFRRELEQGMQVKGTELQLTTQHAFEDHMRGKLKKKPWILDHLMPSFSVTCRRLTPGPGYLEAIQEDNVDFVPMLIKRITETGIELVDGTHHSLDIIVCATGYDTSFLFPFEVVGRDGISLRKRYTPHPESYLSLCTDGFPNWFMINGPNSCFGAGSLILVMEKQVDYAVEVAKKMQRERLKSIEPKLEAVKDFDDYIEAYFKTTVFSEGCSSWYKLGKSSGRIVGLWPGSSLHAVKAFKYPRWEDYNYENLENDHRNRFYWLGDGSTHNEKHMTGDRAWYLNPEEIDYPPVPSTEPIMRFDDMYLDGSESIILIWII
ncbi:FAD NAD-binding domain-containing [Pyrrhoderma noxium]|uniref:FAD NAD-binding domain-containing n=1 Tax=Pyrrhoderma noxium TaxID=2282107 RepID=A0A286U7J2_9AGAM|nr:FAD NAD-binding domain-containing [Pyrrhoderma noxium]